MNPSDKQIHNNEWILSKPTPMRDTEEWWFVPVTDDGEITSMEIHHKPENDMMYVWREFFPLGASRKLWNKLVSEGYRRESQYAK